jgi:DNA processing protein
LATLTLKNFWSTIIIESAEKGGSLVTADIANPYIRDVFAVPGRSTDLYSKGCNDLIKNNKAAILTSAKNLIDMLNWESPNNIKKPIQKQLFVESTENEQLLYDFLAQNGQIVLKSVFLQLKEYYD